MPTELSADYGLRPVDLLALGTRVPGLPSGKLSAPLILQDPPQAIAGVQKAIQCFVSLLLTKQGSAVNPNLGCNFLTSLEQGRIRTESDLRTHYALEVNRVLQQYNAEAFFDDEVLDKADLTAVQVDPGRISMTINFTTRAGTSLKLLVPVSYEN